MRLRLESSVQYLKGVGPRRAEQFARLGIRTMEDLLYHVPHRYLDATTVTPIAKAAIGQEVTLVGRVVSKGVLPTRKGLRIFRAVLQDDSGLIECAWPGQAFLDRTIRPGQLLLVTGPVKHFHGRQVVPREQIVLAEEGETIERSGMVIPIYHATEGLSHRVIRRVIQDNLDALLEAVEDHLPQAFRERSGVLPLKRAFEVLHRPPVVSGGLSRDAIEEGRRRLAFDELLDLQLVVVRARSLARQAGKAGRFTIKGELTTALKHALPFELTRSQKRAIKEITADMVSEERMHRLLMGDVGTGKTVVALFAMLLAVENGYQAVFMAPTELLAEQHARTLSALLAPLGLVPELLIGRMSPSAKAAVRERLSSGEAQIVVGTHALIEDRTAFRNLGLVVIDEQHRFGVEQRAALIEKGEAPEVLLLSATPIPRTLALTLYGDLDISILAERPAGRPGVKTAVLSDGSRAKVYRFVKERCAAGGQAYVVYPVIEESQRVDLRAATTMAEELSRILAPYRVGLVHGRMKPEERDRVMRAFRDGEISVLVSTTVIEVGIDVPGATVMVIEHPERFGLAQLHQLRGRVGRGTEESHCILLTDDHHALPRLKQFARISDGFRIAELDLKQRGMGELAGVRQSGGINLKYTDLSRDGDLVMSARRVAMEILEGDPQLSHPKHLLLRRRLEQRYERGIELFRVG
ncbi:MAG: ATP-dependent DNA helicase RecG [Gemmatimonadales bacterium]|nr:MAG: ATP-dependent DNA helicase RecG [Gemmatimonadales bacterium]